MWLVAADIVNKDAITILVGLGAFLVALGPAIGGIRALVVGIRKLLGYEEKQKAEALLEKDTLNRAEKQIVRDELQKRRAIIFTLLGFMLATLVVGYFMYDAIFISEAKLPPTLAIKSVKALDPDDPWIKAHRAFTPLISSLMPVIADRTAPNAAIEVNRGSQVISITTDTFGTNTSGHPTEETTRMLRFPLADYKFQPPYVFLLKKSDSGESFQGLDVTSDKDGWKFKIPKSDPKDSLLIIGQIVHIRDGTIPSDLSQTFQITEAPK